MQYRIDKKTGDKLSALGFGCMRLPRTMGRTDLQKSETVIMDAIDKGVNFFDTAYIYPGSEVTLGSVLDKNNIREKVYISTKLPLFKCHSYEDFDKIFNEQLTRLKTDYIDYYFMHNISKLSNWERIRVLGIEKWIDEKKSQKKIRRVGFSFHGVKDEFTRVIDSYRWDFCMIQYNYINTHFQAGVDGLKHAHKKDVAVFIMEPLLGGRLAKDLPEKAVKLLKQHNPSATPAAWALRWLWNQPEITLVLSGMNELDQISENVALAEESQVGSMTEEELAIIAQVAEIFSDSYKIPCTGCNYCLPCPVNINIPDSFMAYNTSYAISRFAGIQQYATTAGGFSPAFSVADCTKCQKCEKQCPQNIAIIDRLKDVRKRMEPFWYRLAIKIARRVMR
ncbi:MAG: aldo/keto reductase [Defluviitaleaceae bacterium]|nr:aldo/keto reductase [Defluviitaleaceae bacterium]